MTDTPMTVEQVILEQYKKNFDENTRDRINLDNYECFQLAISILDGKRDAVEHQVQKTITENVSPQSTPENTQTVHNYTCGLFMGRLDELVRELLARRIDQSILDELAKREGHVNASAQASIAELIAIKPTLLATATTLAEIDEYNEKAHQLLTVIEATEYQEAITFRTQDQEHTFDVSEPATVLEQLGDTDKMYVRCRDSYRKDTEDSIMMTTPPPPRRKLARANLDGLVIGDVVASIPKQWTNMKHTSFFGLTFSPHIVVEFTE